MEYNFDIINEQQTPKVPAIKGSMEKYVIDNREELLRFARYASKLTHRDMTPIGLAANQVSLNGKRFMKRAFVAIDFLTRYLWDVIVDPQIIEYIGITELKAEGCLTWPGKKVVAERYRKVRVKYFDLNTGEYVTKVVSGLEAQVWQHEINHLNGVVEKIEDKEFEAPKEIDSGRNELCPCGSNKKYKKCCIL